MFLWYFCRISMEFLLDSCGISKVFPWCFYDISRRFLWEFFWDFFAVPMLFHVISIMIFLWDFCGIPVGFPWYFSGLSMGLLLNVNWK
jgi:hypothetical protein